MGAAALPIAMGAKVIGGGMSMYSSIRKGKMEQAMAERNAQLDEQQAELLTLEGAENVRRGRDNNRRILSSLRNKNAVKGVTGKSLELIESESAVRREMELQDLYRKADMQSKALKDRARQTRESGRQSKRAGYLGAAGTLFSMVGGLSRSRYRVGSKGFAG